MKLYQVRLRGMQITTTGVTYGVAYVVANDPQEAYKKVRTAVDEEDLEASLKDYCYGVVADLPAPSFTYESVDEPRYSLPDNYIEELIPEEMQDVAQSCIVAYNFDNREAFASVGLEFKTDIRVSNAFGDITAAHYADQMAPGWEVLSQLTDDAAGRPGYATKSMPFIAKRVNEAAGMVDYMDVSFGIPLYVKLTVHPSN